MSVYDDMEKEQVVHELVLMYEELDSIVERQNELDLEKKVLMDHRRDAVKALGLVAMPNNYWTTERPGEDRYRDES